MVMLMHHRLGFVVEESSVFPVTASAASLPSAIDDEERDRCRNRKRHPHIHTKKKHSTRERGKAISATVSGKELYDAYSQIRKEYNEKAFHEKYDRDWRVLKETKDGIQIAMLSHPSDPTCPYVRMRAIMPGTMADVWDFLRLSNWDRTMPKMDPFYEGLTVVGSYRHGGVDMVLARKRTKRIVTFGKRDFTFVSVSDLPRHDDVWVSGTVSVVTDSLPRQDGYTRAFQDSVAFYASLPPDSETNEPNTDLTIVCRIDLNDSGEGGDGGMVPMWVYTKTIGSTGVLSIRNMRAELKRMRKEEKRKRKRGRRKHGGRKPAIPRHPMIPWVDFGGTSEESVGDEKGRDWLDDKDADFA